MEFFQEIGVLSSDLSHLVILLGDKVQSVDSIIDYRYFDKDIYHYQLFSLPFKMFLRVLIGFKRFGKIDDNHRNAIFYEFENYQRRKNCHPEDLEKFWALINNFWQN